MSYDIITMFQYILFIIYLIWICMMDNKTYTFSISLVRYNADMFFKYNNISTLPFLYFIYICSKTYCISKYTFKFLTLLKSIFLSTASISYNSLLFFISSFTNTIKSYPASFKAKATTSVQTPYSSFG